MPRCYPSIALAASSHPRSAEDRLTEIYAVALEAHDGFASKVFDLVGLPPADHYLAYTQVSLPDGTGRLDLVVRGCGPDNRSVSVLYGEHKEPGGRLQSDQPAKYLPALDDEKATHHVPGELLLVLGTRDATVPVSLSGDASTARSEVARAREQIRDDPTVPGTLGYTTRTWQDIANCAELAGRDSFGGSDPLAWREAAEQPDALASQRVLRELLWYFEEVGYAVTNGLTIEQAQAAPRALQIEDTLTAWLDAVVDALTAKPVGSFQLRKSGGKRLREQSFKTDPESWPEEWMGGIVISYDPGIQSGRVDGELELSIGLWLNESNSRVLDARNSFQQRLANSEYDLKLVVDDDGGWLGLSCAIAEFITDGQFETMDTQAGRAAEWARDRLAALLALEPGGLPS